MSKVVNLFVDREKQTAGFLKLLEGATAKKIMLIEAVGGMGKSWTIEYMRHQCRERAIRHVEIDFSDGVVYDFLTLLRRSRDSFGAECFEPFSRLLIELAQPSLRLETHAGAVNAVINVGEHNTIANSAVSVSEVGTIIKDSSFVIHADNPVVRQAMQDRLTSVFFECLAPLWAEQPIVFFFDTYDRVTVEAESWLLGQLLPRIRDGNLRNVLVVITGRSVPQLESTWTEVVARTGLDLLSLTHVSEYLTERCKISNIDTQVVQALFQASTGQPQLLALMAENMLRSQAGDSDDDWL